MDCKPDLFGKSNESKPFSRLSNSSSLVQSFSFNSSNESLSCKRKIPDDFCDGLAPKKESRHGSPLSKAYLPTIYLL